MAKKVFVSGCYDMLHSGHVAFFEEAAGYGDLYVGIGSDKTINDLKARKTINSDAERLYPRLGWERTGVIPDYALWPDGGFCDTTVFYKRLPAADAGDII